jgi:hypothetical protein
LYFFISLNASNGSAQDGENRLQKKIPAPVLSDAEVFEGMTGIVLI